MGITERQRAILIGGILGDAYLEQKSKNGSSSFRFKQSKEKGAYVYWMYKELKALCRSKPRQGWNKQISFSTLCHPAIQNLRSTFYIRGRKSVPENIGSMLTNSLSLAVWFMDDGSIDYRLHDHYAFRIATYSFSLRENNLLCKALSNNFGIASSVQKSTMRNKVYYRLYIGRNGRDRFCNLIKPFMQPCLSHKLPSSEIIA